MTARKLAIDPLWQCLCPSWTSAATRRMVATTTRPTLQCLNTPSPARSLQLSAKEKKLRYINRPSPRDNQVQYVLHPLHNGPYNPEEDLFPPPREDKRARRARFDTAPPPAPEVNYREEPTAALYMHMRGAAVDGEYNLCRFIAEMLIKDRGEKPNIQMYNSLIASNVSPKQGAAWRVHDLLKELEEDGLQADAGTCHAVLKVAAVHLDHLLRTDALEYMSQRWFQLSEDGHHDVAAGLFREGLFEKALLRVDMMRAEGLRIRPWLLDIAVYVLCEANEIAEAHNIMRMRVYDNESISRSLWMFFLDKASENRHHTATALAWSSEVNNNHINPSSGMCLNVLTTAAQAADAVLATEVFTKLSDRGSAFQPIHYEQLINCYLAADPPDLKRALSVLTIMGLEKIEPSTAETRSLFEYLDNKPNLLPEAYTILRDLHDQGRKIPIAALNVLIETHVNHKNLAEALNIYKQIHTFAPPASSGKTFANIDTFNLLLRGCNQIDPPDTHQASFLVSELLALRIVPTYITFDRLIITFVRAATIATEKASALSGDEAKAAEEDKAKEFLDWAYRHFQDMQPLGWLPRHGTLKLLAVGLAGKGDERCWDIVQAHEDRGEQLPWGYRGPGLRGEVLKAWEESRGTVDVEGQAESAVGAIGGG